MAYSNFTLESVRKTFQLETDEAADISSKIEPVTPSEYLTTTLARNVPLALAIGTEKAKSEMIVTNVLLELREHFTQRISLFSGIDFSVDAEKGLTGVCDFLISLSPTQFHLEAPIIVLVEAKRDEPTTGFGQCVAEMLAAQHFNAERGNDLPCIYGTATTGTMWHFLKLEAQQLQIDSAVYSIGQCDKILGILASMVEQNA
ncbi:MAG: hypothetical protein OXI24_09360 [Candidatus Poribacteria bacterium]|nr:hypothetical protein [Candidatus Poribacteria bacterium]MDE0554408.1 hypothetical protein [Candidatus Poribacteria bacterium]MYK17419.1 hypothetical protein [Candidatus Poribacteria bacterium]